MTPTLASHHGRAALALTVLSKQLTYKDDDAESGNTCGSANDSSQTAVVADAAPERVPVELYRVITLNLPKATAADSESTAAATAATATASDSAPSPSQFPPGAPVELAAIRVPLLSFPAPLRPALAAGLEPFGALLLRNKVPQTMRVGPFFALTVPHDSATARALYPSSSTPPDCEQTGDCGRNSTCETVTFYGRCNRILCGPHAPAHTDTNSTSTDANSTSTDTHTMTITSTRATSVSSGTSAGVRAEGTVRTDAPPATISSTAVKGDILTVSEMIPGALLATVVEVLPQM